MRMSPTRPTRRGAAAVEMALITPVLLALTMGIMDWAWFLVDYQQVLHASQAGVRTGAQTESGSDPAGKGETQAREVLAASYLGGVPDGATYTGTIINGNTLQLVVSVPFRPLVGMVPVPDLVRATALMRVEDM